MTKTRSFTLDSGYVRDGNLRGRYQIQADIGREGGLVARNRINLFGSDRIKTLLKKHLHKRARGYGYELVLSLNDGEVGHHINDTYVIGIPQKVHESMASNDKDKHRAKVLEWLKVNNRVKYLIVLEVLRKQ